MVVEGLTVATVLRVQERTRGDHPLLVCDDHRISYRAAESESAALACALVALGAGKGTHVGLLYPNGVEFIVAALAAARLGAVVVPFSTFATAPELAHQLRHADIEILMTAARFRSHDYVARLTGILGTGDFENVVFSAAAPQLRHVLVDGAHPPGHAVDAALLSALEADVDGSDPLAIIYTSGSTGPPKGVVHSHAALLGHQRNLNDIRGLTADDRLFCNSPFFWIGGFAFGLLATVVAGATLVCSTAEDPSRTLDLLEKEKPTLTNGFVAGIAHLVTDSTFADRDFSSARRGNLYPIMAPDVRPADPELRHNMLGLTEAGSVALISGDDGDQPEHRRGSFGSPAPGFEIRTVDPDTSTDVVGGELGELYLRGRYLMQRYYKRSREESFDVDGWFHTGDLVRVDPDGFVYYAGRCGAMIKTAGANVSPTEVEMAIAKVTGGVPAHVLGIPDQERGQVVAAVVVADADAFDEAAVRSRLKTELSAYKIPRRFVAVPASAIPVLSSGKVDVRRLREVFDA